MLRFFFVQSGGVVDYPAITKLGAALKRIPGLEGEE